MDNLKLFHACKVGDLDTVKKLVDLKEIPLNIRDRWDSSPLYYACLCGHEEVVRFLLENGANCDANTYEGERCVYGALTNSIRNMLVRDYKIISSKVIERRNYDEFLRKTLESGEFSDFILNMNHTGNHQLHRCILASRCEFFRRKFSNKWQTKLLVNASNDRITAAAFKVFLRFIYTGLIEFPYELTNEICVMLTLAGFKEQVYDIQSIRKPGKRAPKHNILLEYKINNDFQKLYHSAIHYQVQHSDRDHNNAKDFIDDDDKDYNDEICGNNFENSFGNNGYDHDIIFIVENKEFFCHRLFICGRSDYFRSLVQNHFSEARRNENGIAMFELRTISADLFQNFLQFIYTESTDLTYDNVFDLILLSDQYFVPSLKSFCSGFIEKNIESFNTMEILRIARSMKLPKLEQAAIQYIAKNLDSFFVDEQFKQVVLEDAQAVISRHETDSIDIIDDIRYYIHIEVNSFEELKGAFKKIDHFLNSLGLQG